MVNYPVSTLPLSGFREIPADYGDKEQEFHIPYSMSAPTITKGARKFTTRHELLDETGVGTLRSFWADYAAAGSFQIVHPRTGSTITCVAQERPQIRREHARTWSATFNFEEQL